MSAVFFHPLSATTSGGRDEAMEEKLTLVDSFGKTDYCFAVSKYLHDELEVNLRLLKFDRGLLGRLISFQRVRYLSKR